MADDDDQEFVDVIIVNGKPHQVVLSKSMRAQAIKEMGVPEALMDMIVAEAVQEIAADLNRNPPQGAP